RATIQGARQIGFTVVSISVSLIAAFIPLLFMGGIVGRLFREFSVTLAFAIAVLTVVSLSVTPMICAHFVRAPPSRGATRLDRAAAIVEADPAVAAIASSVGASTFNPSLNQGRLFISLKPLAERKMSSARVVERLRQKLAAVTGLKVFLVPSQDLRVGARQSK